MAVLIIITVAILAAALFIWNEWRNAPMGWEDKDGFHFGERPK